MSADWEPGQAVVARWMDRDIRGIIDTDGKFYTTDQQYVGVSSSVFSRENLRPLVVIDPEDHEAVERLYQSYITTASVNRCRALEAALREFANPTPPKPEEPTGLGAVVEDAEGAVWIRAARIRHGWHKPMNTWAKYDDIAAVRVLSEGVTA